MKLTASSEGNANPSPTTSLTIYNSHSMNLTGSLSTVSGTICTLSVLGPYAVLAGRSSMPSLDANRLFTIVAIVNLVSTPLNLLGS